MKEFINKLPVKELQKQLRGVIYPFRDALATLDDEIVLKTLHIIHKYAARSDKLAEDFVQHFHILLPAI